MASKYTPTIIVIAVILSSIVAAQSGTADRDRGIALVHQDNLGEAINVLAATVKRNKKDIRAWHWLATALEKQRQSKDASKAHENAAKTAEELQITASDEFKSLPAIELLEAADSAEHYLALNPSISEKKRNEWLDRAEFLRVQATTTVDKKVYKNSEVTIRARVLRKDEPSYTTEARNNLVTGTVVVRCVFGADGRVRAIHVIKGLPDGLTERAIEVARQIKFIPAMKDGKPVSMWMQLEYNFNLGVAP